MKSFYSGESTTSQQADEEFFLIKEFGYVKSALLAGEHRLKYNGSNIGLDPIVYYDFEIRSNKETVINPDMLKKPDGANTK